MCVVSTHTCPRTRALDTTHKGNFFIRIDKELRGRYYCIKKKSLKDKGDDKLQVGPQVVPRPSVYYAVASLHDKVMQNVLSSAPTNEWLDKQDEFGKKERMSDSDATRIPSDNKRPSAESNSDTDGVSDTKKPRPTCFHWCPPRNPVYARRVGPVYLTGPRLTGQAGKLTHHPRMARL